MMLITLISSACAFESYNPKEMESNESSSLNNQDAHNNMNRQTSNIRNNEISQTPKQTFNRMNTNNFTNNSFQPNSNPYYRTYGTNDMQLNSTFSNQDGYNNNMIHQMNDIRNNEFT